MSARFLRQELLADVGELGQRRIEGSSARVAGEGLAHEIACRYAVAAGFARVVEGAIDLDALAPVALVTHEPARQVLAGARAALAAMRHALEADA